MCCRASDLRVIVSMKERHERHHNPIIPEFREASAGVPPDSHVRVGKMGQHQFDTPLSVQPQNGLASNAADLGVVVSQHRDEQGQEPIKTRSPHLRNSLVSVLESLEPRAAKPGQPRIK